MIARAAPSHSAAPAIRAVATIQSLRRIASSQGRRATVTFPILAAQLPERPTLPAAPGGHKPVRRGANRAHSKHAHDRASATCVAAAALAATGAASAATPALRFLNLTPATVRGTHFVPREQVKVTLRAGTDTRMRTVRATAAGAFIVDFGRLREQDRCSGSVAVTAVGRARRPRRLQAAGDGLPGDGERAVPLEEHEGPPGGGPSKAGGMRPAYVVTLSVFTTCVVPGVTFEVMLACDLYVPACLLEAS